MIEAPATIGIGADGKSVILSMHAPGNAVSLRRELTPAEAVQIATRVLKEASALLRRGGAAD